MSRKVSYGLERVWRVVKSFEGFRIHLEKGFDGFRSFNGLEEFWKDFEGFRKA